MAKINYTDTSNMTLDQMVEKYNEIAEKLGRDRRNSKFRDKATGTKAIHGAEVELASLEQVPEGTADDDTTPKARGRTPSVADDAVVEVLVDNPKRAGTVSHDRFACYGRKGQKTTVGAYTASTGDRRKALRDIAWDWDHGFINVVQS